MNFKNIFKIFLILIFGLSSLLNCSVANSNKNDDDDKKNMLIMLYLLQKKDCVPADHEHHEGEHHDHVHC